MKCFQRFRFFYSGDFLLVLSNRKQEIRRALNENRAVVDPLNYLITVHVQIKMSHSIQMLSIQINTKSLEFVIHQFNNIKLAFFAHQMKWSFPICTVIRYSRVKFLVFPTNERQRKVCTVLELLISFMFVSRS